MLPNGHDSSKITNLFVFLTDSKIASTSRGLIVLRSINSTSIPSSFNLSTAIWACFNIFPNETRVTSLPGTLISAFPIGIKYYSSGTSPLSPYICSDSIKMTGSLSLIADFNKPFAS